MVLILDLVLGWFWPYVWLIYLTFGLVEARGPDGSVAAQIPGFHQAKTYFLCNTHPFWVDLTMQSGPLWYHMVPCKADLTVKNI